MFSFVGPDPGDVVRYGRPTVEYVAGFGARITYGGSLGANFTESQAFSTSRENCWPDANAAWRSNSCDHFGVSTYGTPANITYSWLVGVGGSIVSKPLVAPNVVFNPVYAPPLVVPPPQPAPPIRLEAVVPAQVVCGNPQDNAFWVKITKTEMEDNVDLGGLLLGDHAGARPEIAALKTETEIERQVLQPGVVDEVTKAIDINEQQPSVVFSFEFYRYSGSLDDDGAIDPNKDEFPDAPGFDANALVFVGRQIAGFNPVQPMAAVPEPQTWALMLAGLAGIGAARRRNRNGAADREARSSASSRPITTRSPAVPEGRRGTSLLLANAQLVVSAIKVLNQMPMSSKLSLLMDADSVAAAGTPLINVRPPLEATFILRSVASYW